MEAVMKKLVIVTVLALACGFAWAGEQKIAVADMNKLLRAHPETEKAESVLEGQIDEIEKERDALLQKLEKMRVEVEDIMKQSQNKALSEEKVEQLRNDAEQKYKELRKMDIDAKKELDNRRKDLAEQKMAMHKRIVGEISDVIKEYAQKQGYSFVVDSSGVGVSGMPSIIYWDEASDITKKIEEILAKKKE
jgi:Skp family chaperone for outer membrane proteins